MDVAKAFLLLEEAAKQCQDIVPCKYSQYHASFLRHSGLSDSHFNAFWNITMERYIMEVDSVANYQLASYIGEVGGIMGLFLGWSILYLVEKFVIKITSHDLTRSREASMIIIKLAFLQLFII